MNSCSHVLDLYRPGLSSFFLGEDLNHVLRVSSCVRCGGVAGCSSRAEPFAWLSAGSPLLPASDPVPRAQRRGCEGPGRL